MDVAVFRTLKAGWKDNVQQWRLENYSNPVLKKIHFSPLLRKTLDERINSQILQNGFRKCGLFPWNPNAVDEEALKENKLIRNKNELKLKEICSGINFVEKYINREKITDFKNATAWNGDIADQSLFAFYRSILKEKNDLETEIGKGIEAEGVNETQNNEAEVGESKRTDEFGNSGNLDKDGKNGQRELIAEESNLMQDLEQTNTNSEGNSEKDPLLYEALINSTPIRENTRENILLNQDATPNENGNLDKSIPTPFKKALFWPGPKPLKTIKKKKEKVPSVATSKSWQLYHERKESKKKTLEEEKKKRIEERKQKKEMKAAEKENIKMKKEKKNKRKRGESSDTTSEEEWVPSGSSDEDIENANRDSVDDKETESEKPEDALNQDYKESDYILVSFPGKKRNLQFVCVIQELIDDNELEVIGMKKYADTNSNVFVLNETDVSTIEKSQVLKVLPFPKMSAAGNRLKYEFPDDFTVDG